MLQCVFERGDSVSGMQEDGFGNYIRFCMKRQEWEESQQRLYSAVANV